MSLDDLGSLQKISFEVNGRYGAFHLVCTHLGGRGGGSNLLYISIAYYMQKGGEGVQTACKIAYVLNGRPLYKMFPVV